MYRLGFEFAFTESLDPAEGKALGFQARCRVLVGAFGKSADRRIDLPVRGQLDDAGETDIGKFVEPAYQRFECPLPNLGIGVEKRTYRAFAVDPEPGCSHERSRGCRPDDSGLGNRSSTSSAVPSVDPLSTTTTSSEQSPR